MQQSQSLELKRCGQEGYGAIAVLVNPTNSNSPVTLPPGWFRLATRPNLTGSLPSPNLHFAHVDSESELDLAFATIAEVGAGAVLIASDPFYFSRREQLIALAARYSTPAIYDFRAYAEAGGLASYGTEGNPGSWGGIACHGC